jgi:hypothetical protein
LYRQLQLTERILDLRKRLQAVVAAVVVSGVLQVPFRGSQRIDRAVNVWGPLAAGRSRARFRRKLELPGIALLRIALQRLVQLKTD